MSEQTLTAEEILRNSVDRNRYYRGQLLTVRNLTQEQRYFNSKRWLLNRLLFGSGVICGLQVERFGTELAIRIKKGLALDPLGREVTVTEDRKQDLSGLFKLADQSFAGSKTGYICLSHRDCPTEPAPSLNASSPCETSCESSRWHETFDVSWDEDAGLQPNVCASWLNRAYVRAEDEDGNILIERTTPAWTRQDEVFEVVVRVTGLQNGSTFRLSELITNATLIEPTPPLAESGQFPAPPVTLKPGEFFIYVYQVKSPAGPGSLTINGNTSGLPSLVSTIDVLSAEDPRDYQSQFDIQRICDEPSSTCVRIAKLTVHFTGGKPDSFAINKFRAPKFRYSLERVSEMLDCVRASLSSEAGSPRPGHAFVTFNDLDTNNPTPIGPNPSAGTGFRVSKSTHTHALLRAANSGLEFAGEGRNELRINGDVGGEAIKFLNTVKGVSPIANSDLVTKDYVDSLVAGLDWQESVLDKDLTAPPAAPKEGDRYLLFNEPTEAWKANKVKGKQNDIATFNGKIWEFTAPDEGMAAFVEDENVAYMFVDGRWIAFLATPNVAAGDGLVANGAILSVGKGPGIVVNPNDVAVAFRDTAPKPVGPLNDAGTADDVARGDHRHTITITQHSGLVIQHEGLRVGGLVDAEDLNFQKPVIGRNPVLPEHLATKKYVDDHATAIRAGDGLVRRENTISVGPGAGIKVNADNVEVAFDRESLPQPIGANASAGTPKAFSAFDHIHTMLLGQRGGLVMDDHGLWIDGDIVGEKINFVNPVAGQTPKRDVDLATKGYVDEKVVAPASVTPGAASGIVTFKSSGKSFSAEADINPELGSGHLSVQLAMLPTANPDNFATRSTAENTYMFVGSNPLSGLTGAGGLFTGPVLADTTAEVRPGSGGKPSTFVIRIDSRRFQRALPQDFKIRWFAYTPAFERNATEVVITAGDGPFLDEPEL